MDALHKASGFVPPNFGHLLATVVGLPLLLVCPRFLVHQLLPTSARLTTVLQPIIISVWRVPGRPHRLCPVLALHTYMKITKVARPYLIFVWSDSIKWCSVSHVATILSRVIDAEDPGKLPRAQEVHHMTATLAFLRTHSLEVVQQAGQ